MGANINPELKNQLHCTKFEENHLVLIMPIPSHISLSAVLAPAHLLAYSTLLGTQLYQSIIIVKVAFQALPYEAFTTLQKKLFPTYFRCQSTLLLLTATTIPPYGPLSRGARDWRVFAPLIITGITAVLNLVYFGPKSSRLMMVRRFQSEMEARNGPEGNSSKSAEMEKLDRSFKRAHAMSIHLNAIAIGATLWYGWSLASHLRFE
ncbi:unnamed protein product [Periconia digitata]|uniref:TMEM205-like domain-containing protein n=1 Tax=Periconia digitata TaxID=1303443 RepID=A0A9W4URE8_9PLEO|nr:unnamed protein product [Periconia digitata]